MNFPTEWKNKNVPNHQPACIFADPFQKPPTWQRSQNCYRTLTLPSFLTRESTAPAEKKTGSPKVVRKCVSNISTSKCGSRYGRVMPRALSTAELQRCSEPEVFDFLTSKHALRLCHVQFFISHPSRWRASKHRLFCTLSSSFYWLSLLTPLWLFLFSDSSHQCCCICILVARSLTSELPPSLNQGPPPRMVLPSYPTHQPSVVTSRCEVTEVCIHHPINPTVCELAMVNRCYPPCEGINSYLPLPNHTYLPNSSCYFWINICAC